MVSNTNLKILSVIGWIISALPILMMGIAPVFFWFLKPEMVKDGMSKYGFPPGDAGVIVILEISCRIIYAIPQTAVLGAILLTGYLGGATATHLRAGEISSIPGPVLFGVLAWLGLFLRDRRVRALIPFRRP
jgi:hypothetical protein